MDAYLLNVGLRYTSRGLVVLRAVQTPHPPYNLSVVTSRTSARLSWLPAYDGGFPQHYVVW